MLLPYRLRISLLWLHRGVRLKGEGFFLGDHDDGRSACRNPGGMVERLLGSGGSRARFKGSHGGKINLDDSIERRRTLRRAQYLGGDNFGLSGKLCDRERHVLL